MSGMDFTAGEWPEISNRRDYDRLVRLARRRLVGHEHHAEDVVSRSLIKWATIPRHRRGVARIEQVIKTEAYSLLRSEQRARERDTRVASDPTLGPNDHASQQAETSLRLLRHALAQAAKRYDIRVTDFDVELIELVLAGQSAAEIQRTLGVPRHAVRTSQAKWRQVVRRVL